MLREQIEKLANRSGVSFTPDERALFEEFKGALNRGEIRAAVIESAFASWREEAASAVGGEPPAWWARVLAWLLISDRARPDEAIARCAPRPILIMHGDSDGTVPIEHGRRLRAAGGANVELVEVSGGDHNSLRETNPEIEQQVVWFFRSHLGE